MNKSAEEGDDMVNEFYEKAIKEKDIYKKCELLRKGAAAADIPSIKILAEYGLYSDTDAVSSAEGMNCLERLARMAENISDAETFEYVGDLYGVERYWQNRFERTILYRAYDAKKAVHFYDRALALRPDREIMRKKGEILYRQVFKKDALDLWKMAVSGNNSPSQKLLDDIIFYYEDNPWDKDYDDMAYWVELRSKNYGADRKHLEDVVRILVDKTIADSIEEGMIDEQAAAEAMAMLDQLTGSYESAAGYSMYSHLMFMLYHDYEKAAEYKRKEIMIMEKQGCDEIFLKLPRGELKNLEEAARKSHGKR